jgi:hypothetical protein
MAKCIDKFEDIIDSRDVIARIEELKEERQALVDEVEAARECVGFHHNGEVDQDGEYPEHEEFRRCIDELEEWDASDEADELRALEALASEGEASADWRCGETLIRESYFEDYAQELAEDLGMIPSNIEWPCNCIDWKQATRELRQDYFSVEFDDVTYLIRS